MPLPESSAVLRAESYGRLPPPEQPVGISGCAALCAEAGRLPPPEHPVGISGNAVPRAEAGRLPPPEQPAAISGCAALRAEAGRLPPPEQPTAISGCAALRAEAYGQSAALGPVDRLGVWLSARQLRRRARFAGKRVGDFGCGFQAAFCRTILDEARHVTLVDVALADDLRRHPRITAIEGGLPESLARIPGQSLDVVLCVSVLEHLREPLAALGEFRRLLAPGGVCLVNVPSWRGKFFLELAAFRLGLSPGTEMDDHKMYYDVRDLWPLLVRAGFQPRQIRCFPHKFGLNTFAACRVE